MEQSIGKKASLAIRTSAIGLQCDIRIFKCNPIDNQLFVNIFISEFIQDGWQFFFIFLLQLC